MPLPVLRKQEIEVIVPKMHVKTQAIEWETRQGRRWPIEVDSFVQLHSFNTYLQTRIRKPATISKHMQGAKYFVSVLQFEDARTEAQYEPLGVVGLFVRFQIGQRCHGCAAVAPQA